jgi:TetR/AcrR family transcriptional regulator, tetracycline repressor protein
MFNCVRISILERCSSVKYHLGMAGRRAEKAVEKARRKAPLGREEVVGAALGLLDEVGLDGLTTRRLAERLGVRVGALYWHVSSKQELLAAVADRIMEEFSAAPLAGGDWEERISEEAHRLRRVLLSHRDGARVLVGAIGLGSNILVVAERFLRILREASFSLEMAAYGWDSIASFVTGFVLQEQSAPFGPGSIPEEPERLAEIVNPERFPNLSEWLSLGPHDPDGYFDAKLGLIIGGLRAELP